MTQDNYYTNKYSTEVIDDNTDIKIWDDQTLFGNQNNFTHKIQSFTGYVLNNNFIGYQCVYFIKCSGTDKVENLIQTPKYIPKALLFSNYSEKTLMLIRDEYITEITFEVLESNILFFKIETNKGKTMKWGSTTKSVSPIIWKANKKQ